MNVLTLERRITENIDINLDLETALIFFQEDCFMNNGRSHLSFQKLFCSTAAALTLFLSSAGFADEIRKPVSAADTKNVPLRILTRPGAVLYADSNGEKVLKDNLPVFSSYFVYTRPSGELLASGNGWYEVGSDDKGAVKGWIKGDDLFEWKQTMCLTFSHPDGRNPVLMFDEMDYLETLVNLPADKREASVSGFYTSIDEAAKNKKLLPQDFPILSMEPKMSVDNSAKFTLMPILDYKVIDFEGREARLLDILAVSSSSKDRVASDLRTNKDYVASATEASAKHAVKLENLKFDVVWVIDTTRSMGPYIKKVRESMINISKKIAGQENLKEKIAFGVWGYRDSATIEGLEYVTKNFTPTLQNVDDFVKTMEGVTETKVDSVVFDEDLFSGVNDAINNTAWRDNAARIMILVGDAPGHQAGHEWNVSGQTEETLRARANDANITVFSLHLNPPKAKKYNKVAAKQFKELSSNPGVDEKLYWAIGSNDLDTFAKASDEISGSIVKYLSNIVKNFKDSDAPVAPETTAAAAETPAPAPSANPGEDAIAKSLHAAAVTWLGNEVSVAPPRDIEAWVVDKDLSESTRQSLEVRLLLTKAQLDSVSTLLKEVIKAGETNVVSGEDFFTSLQAASAVVARDPDKIENATDIAGLGLVPDFLSNLPYKSRLMEMNSEVWESWGPDEQNDFLNNLESKIKAYASIHDDTSMWIPLNPGDDTDDYVAPILLDLMP